jgi:zinc transport system ATP-binding protein
MQIDMHNLSFSYGHRQVLEDLSLTVNPGDYVVIQGKNGSGKSTLAKCLLGFNPVKSGMIFYDHEDITTFSDWTQFGYVPQQLEDFNYEFPVTVEEFLTFSSIKNANQSHRLKLLDQIGILDLVNENINNLSGGQLQRVFIVRAMLNNPDVLILDEPAASIDRTNINFFYKAVNQLNLEGITVILITHNESLDHLNYSHVLTLGTDLSYTYKTRKSCEIGGMGL